MVRRLVEQNVHVDLVSGESDALSNGSSFHYLEGLPVLSVPSNRPIRAWAALKRLFDVLVAAVALMFLAPGSCSWRSGFAATRPGQSFSPDSVGRERRCFELLKFRTMVDDADSMQRWTMP